MEEGRVRELEVDVEQEVVEEAEGVEEMEEAEETEEAAYRTAGNTDIKPSLLNLCQLFYYTTDPYLMIINFM